MSAAPQFCRRISAFTNYLYRGSCTCVRGRVRGALFPKEKAMSTGRYRSFFGIHRTSAPTNCSAAQAAKKLVRLPFSHDCGQTLYHCTQSPLFLSPEMSMSPAFRLLLLIMLQLLSHWQEVFVTGHCCRPAHDPNPGNAFLDCTSFCLTRIKLYSSPSARNASRRSFPMPSHACRKLQHTSRSRGAAKDRTALAFQ